MKIRNIKGKFPCKKYTRVYGPIKLEANIYKDNSGKLCMQINEDGFKHIITDCEDGTLHDWIEETIEEINYLKTQLKFLKDIRKHHENLDKK